MAFDECAPYPCDREYAIAAMNRTHAWAERSKQAWMDADCAARGGWKQTLFGITQGSVHRELREQSAEFLSVLDLPGYAIGGLAVGEPLDERNKSIAWSTAVLPKEKPRYLMGVGKPIDILDAVERGVDMFDCVLPTRSGRTAQLFTWSGVLNMRNARFKEDFGPLDPDCKCAVCQKHSRAYLRHLYICNEILAARLATYHNLSFFGALMEGIRAAITAGDLPAYRQQVLAKMAQEPEPVDMESEE
jgi:queuine tRNA-ribosyltransferase